MALMATFALSKEDEGRAHYAEIPGAEGAAILGTLSIDLAALPRPTPAVVRIALYLYDTPLPTGHHEATVEAPIPRPGDEVIIVKNAMAGTRYPPEWLEQYLGKSGKVLWITPHGAMVGLEQGATWFPFAELRQAG
jgi:hypothetical protein